jgi:ATP-dependent DNA helicase RecQ
MLLRTYDGIFDFPAVISEAVIANLLKMNKEEVKEALLRLHYSGIIHYAPQKESPQIFFAKNRVRTSDLFINLSKYEERKKRYNGRIDKMIRYTLEPNECRSKITANYFGDMNMQECGICDNCLHKKETMLTHEEFSNIYTRIVSIMRNESMSAKELMSQLSGVKKEKAWKVLDSLQAENRIVIDGEGSIRLK